jgi:hypothetical protein
VLIGSTRRVVSAGRLASFRVSKTMGVVVFPLVDSPFKGLSPPVSIPGSSTE